MRNEILLLLVMFWNLENFFDPFIGNGNAAFTPTGEKFWTWKKFARKRDNIAKTITLVKEHYGKFPALIGMCEVENYFVLNQLTQNTLLAPLNYGIIHKDSPDSRGIDAALLYRKSEFKPLMVDFYPIKIKQHGDVFYKSKSAGMQMKADSILPTRLLLYVKGEFKGLDTLHCFVAHWPSKLGGERASAIRREAASALLKGIVDSILLTDRSAKIVVMGDFNDHASSKSLQNLDNLVNMSLVEDKRQRSKYKYTYKYKESWSRIDHFLISEGLFNAAEKERNNSVQGKNLSLPHFKYLFCYPDCSEVFRHDFLLERDNLYLGYKPRRTLIGPRYNGGVSDHLPIILKIYGYDF